MYLLQEYEYICEDLHECCICKSMIENKYCVYTRCGKKYYMHKLCLADLLHYKLEMLHSA